LRRRIAKHCIERVDAFTDSAGLQGDNCNDLLCPILDKTKSLLDRLWIRFAFVELYSLNVFRVEVDAKPINRIEYV